MTILEQSAGFGRRGRATRAAFPTLRIRASGFEPQGAFAQAQAEFLEPDPETVSELDRLLAERQAGVVAHFYMDAELQGTLAACASPHVHVADSLQMAERAVQMAAQGARAIVVLGVDFMSENVRATLDAAGFTNVPVYRVASAPIGCSLAEAAEALPYRAYLARGARTPRSLHVIYVNTSLRVKAYAERLLPTITCTSSNVLPLLLQAFAQVPDLHVWFGPDTYMGRNLEQMLGAFEGMSAAEVAALHAAHSPASLSAARTRFSCFEQGSCIVHHMFGSAVVERVQRDYPDAFITAHLEVPGEMFELGFRAQREGRGVVGSTSNILDFITRKVDEAARARTPDRLQFVLGTESGMTASIARSVRGRLSALRNQGAAPDLSVEIVFPVAADAISQTADADFPIAPGVAQGEGCSVAGGCASCPYMKMNSLDSLLHLLQRMGDGAGAAPLAAYAPKTYTERVGGHAIAELAGRTITRMREFQRTGRLPDELVRAIEHHSS